MKRALSEPILPGHLTEGHYFPTAISMFELGIIVWDKLADALRNSQESRTQFNKPSMLTLYLQSRIRVEVLPELWATWISKDLFPGDILAHDALIQSFRAFLEPGCKNYVDGLCLVSHLHVRFIGPMSDGLTIHCLGHRLTSCWHLHLVSHHELIWPSIEFPAYLLLMCGGSPYNTFNFLSVLQGMIFDPQRSSFIMKREKKATDSVDVLHDVNRAANEGKEMGKEGRCGPKDRKNLE